MRVLVVVVKPGRGIDRAAEHFGRIAARFGPAHVPVDIRDKGPSAAVLYRLDHLAHEDGVHCRVTQVVARVELDDDRLVFHAVAHVQFVQDQVQLCRQCFLSVQPRLAR